MLCSLCQLQRAKLVNGAADAEAGSGNAQPQRKWHSFISPIFLQALTLTFVAEWGDRSQLTTIILAAREVCLPPVKLFVYLLLCVSLFICCVSLKGLLDSGTLF